MELCVKYKVPVIITSLGAREDVNQAIHSYGGVVLHDIINNRFAHKAIEKGADGLIAVAAGAGGHAGVKSPFALIQEIREWFDGPLALSGAIANGGAVLAAQAAGADLAYIGSAFIATQEARAAEAYKQCIVQSTSDDIVYSNFYTGIHGNYLRPSVVKAGFDPDNLPEGDPKTMNFASGDKEHKVWRDIWGSGHVAGGADLRMSESDGVFNVPVKSGTEAIYADQTPERIRWLFNANGNVGSDSIEMALSNTAGQPLTPGRYAGRLRAGFEPGASPAASARAFSRVFL